MTQQVQQTQNKSVAQRPIDEFKGLLNSPNIRKRIEDVIGKEKVGMFISSMLSVGEDIVNKAEPMSIIKSSLVAASMNLPINKDLGFAYIVPYKGKAQFQMGYKGLVQLAQRSGQYKMLNTCTVYEGEIGKENKFTGEYELNPGGKTSDKVVGYYAYMQLVNGFEKGVYWSKEKVEQHAKKYSQSYSSSTSVWSTGFDGMAEKTVLKNMLQKWGILSVEMERAIIADQAEIQDIARDEEGVLQVYTIYPDNEAPQVKDIPDAAASDTVNDIEEMVMEMCAEVPRDAKTVMKVIAFVRAESGMTDNAIRAAFREYREERKLPSIDWAKWWEAADVSDILAFASHVKKAK